MDVLVVESEQGVADGAIEQLEQAGHHVHRCHEPGAPAFPCAGLGNDRCPLETGPIDVALTVRSAAGRQPTVLEDGISCALRHRIPVVVAGETALHPFEFFGATSARHDHVVETCERARDALPVHGAVARKAVVATLAASELHAGADAEVLRRGGRLQVLLLFPAGTPDALTEMASVRAVGALRAYDRHAAGIDVECRTATDEPA